MATNLANQHIKHVFVLMLENRSFDHMLGFSGLSGKDPVTGKTTSINGVNASNTNSYKGVGYPATKGADFILPFDPGHEFPDVLEQLCGAGTTYKGGAYPPINNSGFVSNYATTKSSGEGGATDNFGEIMKCYDPAQLPVMMALAKEFAVCDNWFASMPGPTWPNRFFVHAASSAGLDHSPRTIETLEWETIKGFSFPKGTIYQLLSANNKTWRLYRGKKTPMVGSIPCVAALKGIKISDTTPYEKFQTDLNGNYPWDYTFIEPNYGDIINNSYAGGQSQHPMDDVRNGEALIKSTYEAIRNSPIWPNSLLIIAYDEHGGFYDHVPAPPAVAPGDIVGKSKYNQYAFDFTKYGVRVPALVISPYTEKGLISHLPYDHSSVPATIEAIFGLPSMTARDAKAENLSRLASLTEARTDTPARLPDPAPVIPEKLAAARKLKPLLNEATLPADEGNLPGFLHIVMKEELEHQKLPEAKGLMMDHYSEKIRTKADARQYLESSLPALMG